MENSRRDFLRWTGLLGISIPVKGFLPNVNSKTLDALLIEHKDLSPNELATNENFWKEIRAQFGLSKEWINLNNGGVSPSPLIVQEAVELLNRKTNEIPSKFLWSTLNKQRDESRKVLADLLGADPKEVAIQRNATEALESIVFGLPLEAGDEVILSERDYPSIVNAWKQRARRDRIVLKWVSLDFPLDNPNKIIRKYKRQMNSKTKLVHITHINNYNGQIFPVAQIAKIAKSKGIEVLVDAAHSFGNLDFKVKDLHCDYLGTSLHKWLMGPIGTGLLYVQKSKIQKIWPLFAHPIKQDDKITKFEHLGTRALGLDVAIIQATTFQQKLGLDKKWARLQYLTNYFLRELQKQNRIKLFSTSNPEYASAIVTFELKDKNNTTLFQALNKAQIHLGRITQGNINGMRISPNIYTSIEELDRFVAFVNEF